MVSLEKEDAKKIQLPFLGTHFLNPSYEPATIYKAFLLTRVAVLNTELLACSDQVPQNNSGVPRPGLLGAGGYRGEEPQANRPPGPPLPKVSSTIYYANTKTGLYVLVFYFLLQLKCISRMLQPTQHLRLYWVF